MNKTSYNRDAIRDRVKSDIKCTDYLRPAPNHRGDNGYICPACGSGTHNGRKSTGAVKYYPATNTWSCHKCGAAGDVIDLYQKETGADYSTALADLSEKIGVNLPGAGNNDAAGKNDRAQATRSAETEARQGNIPLTAETAQEGAQRAIDTPADFTAYYKYCQCGNLTNQAAIDYITGRGISLQTANNFNIGFDAAADPAIAPGATGNEYKAHPAPRIIVPCTNHFYYDRAIDPATPKEYKSINPAGSSTKPFFNCLQLAAEKPTPAVFIAEGVFDALALIECGAPAVALNGAGNGNKLLEYIDKYKPQTSFIICPDNEEEPEKAERIKQFNEELNNALQQRGYNSIIYNVAGIYHDANDALQADRPEFEKNIKKAQAEATALPDLLTYDSAVNVLATADDRHININHFAEFSKKAKIKVHDSVVIAADTGAGKSSLTLNFIDSLNSEYPIIYFNLEMDALTILRRLVAIHSGIELDRIEGYQKDDATAAEVNRVLKEITDRKPLQILQTVYDINAIEAEIQRATAGRQEPTIVVIDHSLLVTEKSSLSRYERFTEISERLRQISRTNNIILFVLLQQSREGKKDENERPKNYSLKESGSWENDATQIVFLWYDPKARRKKLLLTKNRAGDLGEFILDYNKKTQTYRENETETKKLKQEFTPAGADAAAVFDKRY